MSLFGDLYVGTSGLQSSQEALNVVAHNVTNTDTKGYVRQQVSQGTVIGYVGTTGYSTGNHLHFEVYYGGSRIDPYPLVAG